MTWDDAYIKEAHQSPGPEQGLAAGRGVCEPKPAVRCHGVARVPDSRERWDVRKDVRDERPKGR